MLEMTDRKQHSGSKHCTRCILDESDDPAIHFDSQGVCNHCRDYDSAAIGGIFTGENGERRLTAIVRDIQERGKGKPHDCIMGLSGGADSTYVAYLARDLGLRPLAVHFDNGWNSELSVKNIENIVTRLGLDLFTYVINWEEFRDLQLAYLRASVVDIEAITDHAIITTLHRLAAERGVKFILSGSNLATEAVLPSHWIHNKMDHVNIRAIHRAYGTKPLRTFPLFNFRSKRYLIDLLGIRTVPILNYVPYVKKDVKRVITEELGWRDYGGKHYESVFTRFYQGYILPTKFGIDKRKAHLSNLICSGQMTREEALAELSAPGYDPELLRSDKEFVLKKLGLSKDEFDGLMREPPRAHTDYDTEGPVYEMYPLLRPFRPLVKLARQLRRTG